MQIYPAMRARMGDHDYYIVRMRMKDVANEVSLASDLWTDETLSDAMQRTVNESRVKYELVKFLAGRSDRFFSSLVVAAVGGQPNWTPIPSRFGREDAFGELAFASDPAYYALDGQHRLRAVKELLEDRAAAPRGFANEQLSVIVVLSPEGVADRIWVQRYRRLFTSLNRYAKPTDADTNIIMDEDDRFAILTRQLISEHPFFKAPGRERESFRVLTKGKGLKSGAPHFTSLQALYEMNTELLTDSEIRRLRGTPREWKTFLRYRPADAVIEAAYTDLGRIWDALLAAMPELRKDPGDMRWHEEPTDGDPRQDHLAFWPIGQEVLAPLARALLDRGDFEPAGTVEAMTKELSVLAELPWDLHRPPWKHLLLVPDPKKPTAFRMRNEDRKQAVAVAGELLRWLAGLDPLNDEDVADLRSRWAGLLYRGESRETPESETEEAMWKSVEQQRAAVAEGVGSG